MFPLCPLACIYRSSGTPYRILILAGAVFHQPGVQVTAADIFDAHSVLLDIVGRGEKFRKSHTTVT